MALLKKKNDGADEVSAEPVEESAPTAAPALPDDLFAGGPAIDLDDDSMDTDEPVGVAAAAAPAMPTEGGGGGDALLNMFQATEHEAEDRSVLLDLAGSAEIADLLEDLQDVAVALGIVVDGKAAAA